MNDLPFHALQKRDMLTKLDIYRFYTFAQLSK